MKKLNIFLLFLIFFNVLNPTLILAGNAASVSKTNLTNKPSLIFKNIKFDHFYSFVEQLKTSQITHHKLLQLIRANIYSSENQEEIECNNIFDAIDKKNFKQILKYKDQVNSTNEYEQTALIHAILQNNDSFDLIYILILLGAEINKTDKNDNHPLMLAIANQLPLSVKVLLQFGTKVNAFYKNPDLNIGFASDYKTPLALAKDMIIATNRNIKSLFIIRELIIAGAKD